MSGYAMGDVHELVPGQKVLILGMNGSGKSVIAQGIAASWALGPVVIVDTKGDDPAALIPNCAVCYSADDVVRHLPGRVVWRPSLDEKSRHRAGDDRRLRPLWCRFEQVCRKLWELARAERRPTLVVVHELRELCTEQRIGPMFRELITAGRTAGITLVLVTQRPQRVALEARSEAQHVIVLTLTDPSAREEAAALLADPNQPELVAMIRQRSLPLDFRWWYRGPDFRLALHDPVRMG
jgi:hypothetical protein